MRWTLPSPSLNFYFSQFFFCLFVCIGLFFLFFCISRYTNQLSEGCDLKSTIYKWKQKTKSMQICLIKDELFLLDLCDVICLLGKVCDSFLLNCKPNLTFKHEWRIVFTMLFHCASKSKNFDFVLRSKCVVYCYILSIITRLQFINQAISLPSWQAIVICTNDFHGTLQIKTHSFWLLIK